MENSRQSAINEQPIEDMHENWAGTAQKGLFKPTPKQVLSSLLKKRRIKTINRSYQKIARLIKMKKTDYSKSWKGMEHLELFGEPFGSLMKASHNTNWMIHVFYSEVYCISQRNEFLFSPKFWEQSKCSSTRERISKWWYICSREDHRAGISQCGPQAKFW